MSRNQRHAKKEKEEAFKDMLACPNMGHLDKCRYRLLAYSGLPSNLFTLFFKSKIGGIKQNELIFNLSDESIINSSNIPSKIFHLIIINFFFFNKFEKDTHVIPRIDSVVSQF